MARCIGKVSAWASNATVGVDQRAPVMNDVDVRWTHVSLVVKTVDPHLFFFPVLGRRWGCTIPLLHIAFWS